MATKRFAVSIVIGLLLVCAVGGTIIQRTERLAEDDYVVSWIADTELETIEFTVVAKTRGYIGFGLSPSGKMFPADVVIGGVNSDGSPYFNDYFNSGYAGPIIDAQQDWTLIEANETETHTTLRFNRTFVTCDEADISIPSDFTNIIWSIGATDKIEQHVQKDFSSVYLLDPPPPASDTTKFESWEMFVNTTMPSRDTSYWCTVHKTPERFTTKRHIVGFQVPLISAEARTHTHHLVVHHCPHSPGSDEGKMLEAAMATIGGECYDLDGSGMQEIVALCQTYFYVWAKGGKPLFMPEDVGIPLNEKNEPEYFILEIHYDNPQSLANVSYTTGVEIYTVPTPREIDGGLLSVMRAESVDFMIPPESNNYQVNAHCGSQCLAPTLPQTGIAAYNVLLHSHLTGRKIKLRHFRDGNELPWILNDEHYNFDFQQNRPLAKEIQILPTDQLTVECTYDSTGHSTPVFAGLSTRNEMCDAFIMYYPRVKELNSCGTQFVDLDIILTKFGIQEFYNYTDIVSKPPELEGLRYEEVLNEKVDWTPTLKEEIQEATFNRPHYAICVGPNGIFPPPPAPAKSSYDQKRNHVLYGTKETPEGMVTYPENYVPFVPADSEAKCSGSNLQVSYLLSRMTALILIFWNIRVNME